VADPAKLTVAFICTGNRFRSPLAAAAFSAGAGAPVCATSAGVLELGPVPALPEAVELARSFELDLGSHRAKALSELDLASFDLVLGFERNHVEAAVVDAGARIERTFTLPEVVLLLGALPPHEVESDLVARARSRVARAHAARQPHPRSARVPEVVDPLGRQRREQRKVAEQVSELVRRLTQLLFG
jgi:low molecular weight protein-tyrosine phosphatase